jgi:hypothetical protein
MQFQSTPQVGSKTIDFPLSYYILKEDLSFELKSYQRPDKGDRIRNMELSGTLKSAFSFFPGQHITWNSNRKGAETHQDEWEVHADIYNNTYFLCKETRSRAWFKQESDMFYFTHFQGDKNSILYYFFLGAFRVAFTHYKDLQLHDTVPANVLAKGPALFLQDFLAPFYLFLRSSYQLNYFQAKDELDGKEIKLKSLTSFSKPFGKDLEIGFDLFFKDDSLEKIVVMEPNKDQWEMRCEIPS